MFQRRQSFDGSWVAFGDKKVVKRDTQTSKLGLKALKELPNCTEYVANVECGVLVPLSRPGLTWLFPYRARFDDEHRASPTIGALYQQALTGINRIHHAL